MSGCYGIPKDVVTGALLISVEQMASEAGRKAMIRELKTRAEDMLADPDALADYRENPEPVEITVSFESSIESEVFLLLLDHLEEQQQAPENIFEVLNRLLAAANAPDSVLNSEDF